ncbi:hypothetical protein [Actinopolymorpha pittospori]|uniref:Uncharacterized protein n=1 Tax=Actinopolymorpha pittospori TaxID=648752 RepID=A0A927R6T1_9ACTN|nr:hypothetical protein [Actinopolymorpha pittospori]MBE1604772.1 hypothetical protein [Actinopolymorpha pittospori]
MRKAETLMAMSAKTVGVVALTVVAVAVSVYASAIWATFVYKQLQGGTGFAAATAIDLCIAAAPWVIAVAILVARGTSRSRRVAAAASVALVSSVVTFLMAAAVTVI